ncbi:MAG TPA: S-methyl-5-thioribose-1-phosphate isomerase [Candidatus Limnocylindrales bacterium]|jgi:methylthioribose-1-phosphate isomerase
MTDQRTEPEPPPSAAPANPDRRRFFRQFAGEVLTSAAQVVGAVSELRDRSAAEASSLLGEGRALVGATAGAPTSGATSAPIADGSAAEPAGDGAPTGFRTPFRFESDSVLLLIDQRKLPDALVEMPVRSASDAANAIRLMVVRGAPAIGQVAAIGLALTARIAAKSEAHTRRAILEGAANMLRGARPTAINLGWAVERLMARYHAIGELSEDGEAIASALYDEAMAIVAEATDDHGRLAEAGRAILPATDDRPLRILTHCNTGPLACGQFGTALGVVQATHHAERPLHVWVDETRPYLQGARLTAWELKQAGVPHTLIPDMAAGPLMARGEVDVIVVGADRIAANGDTANKIGTYTLAVLAARHGVPFLVCAPMSSVDLDTPDGDAIPIEDRPAIEVTEIRGVHIAPEGTAVKNPSFDVTPADLITAIVTEEGALRAPFGPALVEAMARREARRAAAAAAVGAAAAASDPPAAPVGAAS